MNYKELVNKLNNEGSLLPDEYMKLINIPEDQNEYLFECARKSQHESFGNHVFMRGLIELTNYCKNDCYYCGIGRSNENIKRYRLTVEEVLECCKVGHELGFRTFVIQGGEDPYYTDSMIEEMIIRMKEMYPENAITLSLGEREISTYKKWFNAGADRYLLRHESATESHYNKLHPSGMRLSTRLDCLKALKGIGYQTGAGFMVGSPFQTDEELVNDILFLEELKPEMIGIGPFISHKDTRFASFNNGSVEKTLVLIAILRLMNPNVLLPATTALGSASDDGRERGILAGANVVMPNITPKRLRKLYSLYDGKINTGADTAEGMDLLNNKINNIGYKLISHRGDYSEKRTGVNENYV